MSLKRACISIIIPVKNEQKRIGASLTRLIELFTAKEWEWELIVVDNKSFDNTEKEVKKVQETKSEAIQLLKSDKEGKGGAVKEGILAAKNNFLLVTDCDLAVSPEHIEEFMAALEQNRCDIAIATRHHPKASALMPQPKYRQLFGQFFSFIVSTFFLSGISDSQCGFKLFKREAAKEIFRRLGCHGFSFDVEILLLAKKLGYLIQEIPVKWEHKEPSSINVFRDGSKMLLELCDIYWRYNIKQFR